MSRVSVHFEPRDLWVGAFVSRRYVYVCVLPTLVIRYRRRTRMSIAQRHDLGEIPADGTLERTVYDWTHGPGHWS